MTSNWFKLVSGSAAIFLAQAGLFAPASQAQDSSLKRETLIVVQGASLPIPVSQAFGRLAVSEPIIADAAPVSTTEYYIRGRLVGTTNILIYSEDGKLQQIMDVKVIPDIYAIERDLTTLFPDVDVELHSVADRIHVRGEVADAGIEAAILDIVSSHAPDRVINAMKVALPQQVLLEVRFVEASRDDIKEVGFGSEISRTGDYLLLTTPSLLSGPVQKTAATVFGGIGGVDIDVFLNALEEQGVVRTLAEPNLVARSGETASFLAGGEFPVPVAADDGAVTIAFKNFGVSLDFAPTVINKDRIIIKVTPEVSQLDPRNSVRLSDVEIPALSVRKVDTTVELGDGQSFAIAGLLQNTYDSSSAQTPLLGNIPILGALFRSSRFRNNETELVVIITPRLVSPTSSGTRLDDPLANAELPSDAERYLLGEMDAEGGLPFGEATRRNIEAQAMTEPVANTSGAGS